MSQTTHHLGLRGLVLDTMFGHRNDVTQPLVLTRIRQDVSSGKCVAGMVSDCTLRALPKSIPPVLPSPARFVVSHPLDSGTPVLMRGCGTFQKSKLVQQCLARPGHWRIFESLDLHSGNARFFRLEMWTPWICIVFHEHVLGLVDIAV